MRVSVTICIGRLGFASIFRRSPLTATRNGCKLAGLLCPRSHASIDGG
jgi:hypothetical protein